VIVAKNKKARAKLNQDYLDFLLYEIAECPPGDKACVAEIEARAVPVRERLRNASAAAKRKVIKLGTKRITLKPNTKRDLKFRVSKAKTKKLRRAGKVKVTIVTSFGLQGAKPKRVTRKLTVKLKKR
jgi:hypothetical protein